MPSSAPLLLAVATAVLLRGAAAKVNPPPPPPPPPDLCRGVNCGAHGSCDSTTGSCVCRDGYSGSTCGIAPTPCNAATGGALYKGCPSGTYGQTCTETCDHGYTGSSTKTCNELGYWMGSDPTCTPRQCAASTEETPPEASANTDAGCPAGYFTGPTCTLHCEYGYEFAGDPQATGTYECNADGQWVPQHGGFACTGRPCSQATLPLGAAGSGGTVGPKGLHQLSADSGINGYLFPSSVEFACKDKQGGLKQHVTGEAGWVCSNKTFAYDGADNKAAKKDDVSCTGCPSISHCPAENLECAMYHGSCTSRKCTKHKWGKCKEHKCNGWQSLSDRTCSACDEGYGLVTGKASTCGSDPSCKVDPHVPDKCVKFTSLEPSVCEEQKCAHANYGGGTGAAGACTAKAGCQMKSDSPQSGTTKGLHEIELDLTNHGFWASKTVTVTLAPAPPDPKGGAAEFYWERPTWNAKSDMSTAVTFSAPDTWTSTGNGQGSLTLHIPEDVPANTAVVTATFTRPGLYNLHFTVAGCHNGASTESCVFDATSKAPLNVGPGDVSLTNTGLTFDIDKSRVDNKWFEPVVSGDRFIKVTQTTFNDNQGEDHDHHNITVVTTVLDDHNKPRTGQDELLIELKPTIPADLPTVLLATQGLMQVTRHPSEAPPVEIRYGDADTGTYMFNHSLQHFGVYTVKAWVCDRGSLGNCNTRQHAMANTLMGGTIPKFTLCPQNTADKSKATGDCTSSEGCKWSGSGVDGADFFKTGSHLDKCECLPGFHSTTGKSTTCEAVEAGKAGSGSEAGKPGFGGRTADLKTCDAGTSCGCDATSQAGGYEEDCQSLNWNPACAVDRSGGCRSCKKQSYQNLPGQAGCWACGNGFKCFEGAMYPLALAGYWVSPVLDIGDSDFADGTLDCMPNTKGGTPSSPCKRCASTAVCPGSILLDPEFDNGVFEKFAGDKKLSRVTPGEVPKDYRQCFISVEGSSLQQITGAGLSPKANGFQPPPSTADQAGFDGGTQCLDVIGSRCGSFVPPDGHPDARQSFKSRWSSASKAPSICGVCCDETDVHIGSCLDPETRGTHKYITGQGTSGQLMCTMCSASDRAGLWHATVGAIPGKTWLVIIICLVLLFKLTNFLRKLNVNTNAVIALFMSLLTFLQTIDMIHSRTSQNLVIAKDGKTSSLLTLCTESSDCGWLQELANRTVYEMMNTVAPVTSFNMDVAECAFTMTYDEKWIVAMFSPILVIVAFTICGFCPLWILTASAQIIEQLFSWDHHFDPKRDANVGSKKRVVHHDDSIGKKNEEFIGKLRYKGAAGPFSPTNWLRIFVTGICIVGVLLVALPILVAWWLLWLVTLGGGDWTDDPASLFPKYAVPRKIGQAIGGAIGGAMVGALASWGLVLLWIGNYSAYIVFFAPSGSIAIGIAGAHYGYDGDIAFRPQTGATGQRPVRESLFGLEAVVDILASGDLMGALGLVNKAFLGYLWGAYVYIMRLALGPLFCSNGVMVSDQAVECNTCSTDTVALDYLSYGALLFGAWFSAIMYGAGVPLCFYSIVYNAKRDGRIKHDTFAATYGFLTTKMSDDAYYWEVVILIRKGALAVSAKVFAEDLPTYLLFTLIIVLVSMYLHLQYMPFANDDANFVESTTLMSTVLLLAAALGRLTNQDGEQNAMVDEFVALSYGCVTVTIVMAAGLIFKRVGASMSDILHIWHQRTSTDDPPNSEMLLNQAVLPSDDDSELANVAEGGMRTRPASPEPGAAAPQVAAQRFSLNEAVDDDDALTWKPEELDMFDRSIFTVVTSWVSTQPDTTKLEQHRHLLRKFSDFSVKVDGITRKGKTRADEPLETGPRWHTIEDELLQDELTDERHNRLVSRYEGLMMSSSHFKAELRPILYAWMQSDDFDEQAFNALINDLIKTSERHEVYVPSFLLSYARKPCGCCNTVPEWFLNNRLIPRSWKRYVSKVHHYSNLDVDLNQMLPFEPANIRLLADNARPDNAPPAFTNKACMVGRPFCVVLVLMASLSLVIATYQWWNMAGCCDTAGLIPYHIDPGTCQLSDSRTDTCATKCKDGFKLVNKDDNTPMLTSLNRLRMRCTDSHSPVWQPLEDLSTNVEVACVPNTTALSSHTAAAGH